MIGRRIFVVAALALVAGLTGASISAYDIEEGNFERTWSRTDLPVATGEVDRTWMWGPEGHTEAFLEPYLDAPGEERLVQYMDKSRMEDNAYRADAPWDVTNGLLATELITGRIQLGDQTFEQHTPANVHFAGDPHPDSPTYAMMTDLLDVEPLPADETIVQTIDGDGNVGTNPDLSTYGVTAYNYVIETDHMVASVFWDFMTSSGTVYEDGMTTTDDLFENPYFATGFPITEGYWVYVPVSGEHQWVLTQCFERRCLTYTPGNSPGWQVEAANIGQHYYQWRYEEIEAEPEPYAFNVTPGKSTNNPGDTHEITVYVYDQFDEPYEGAEVVASVTDGPHDGETLTPDPSHTDEDGYATLSYTGSEEGTDTITVYVDGIDESQYVYKTWDEEWEPPVPYEFEIYPEEMVNAVGESHEIIVTVLDQHGEPYYGAEVTAEVTDGPHDETTLTPDPATTDGDGYATLSYTGNEEGIDTITVWVDGIDESQWVEKTWKLEVEYAYLELDPQQAVNEEVGEHTVTAQLLDDNEHPVGVSGVTINFEVVTGPSQGESHSEPTDGNGQATFSYFCCDDPVLATDTIEAEVADNPDINDTALKEWDIVEILLYEDLELTPQQATNEQVGEHTVTAQLVDGDGQPVDAQGVGINFDVVTGPSDDEDHFEQTDANGQATFTYFCCDNPVLATDTIEAWVTAHPDMNDTASKTWDIVQILPYDDLELTPQQATNEEVGEHTVTAQLVDFDGDPVNVDGVSISFEVVTGPSEGESHSEQTDGSGQATFTYECCDFPVLATDTIEAWVTAHPDMNDSASKTWDIVTVPPN